MSGRCWDGWQWQPSLLNVQSSARAATPPLLQTSFPSLALISSSGRPSRRMLGMDPKCEGEGEREGGLRVCNPGN